MTGSTFRRHWAPLLLVTASILASVGSLLGFAGWVTALAAVVAVVAGYRTVAAEIIQPERRNALLNSVAIVTCEMGESGNAFSVGNGLWITADHVLRTKKDNELGRVTLWVDNRVHEASVVEISDEGWAVLAAPSARRPLLLPARRSSLHINDSLAIATVFTAHNEVLSITRDYTYSGPVERGHLLSPLLGLSGPAPMDGTAGAPVYDIRSGKVCAMVYWKGTQEQLGVLAYGLPLDSFARFLRRNDELKALGPSFRERTTIVRALGRRSV